MSPRQKQRLIFVAILVVGFTTAAGLVIYSLERNLLYFFTPSQVMQGLAPIDKTFSLGGMVVEGSVVRGEQIQFAVTDNQKIVNVIYQGLLPDLFGEGQGVVTNGQLNKEGIFIAESVLAKHDENYMPPNVAKTLLDKPISIERLNK